MRHLGGSKRDAVRVPCGVVLRHRVDDTTQARTTAQLFAGHMRAAHHARADCRMPVLLHNQDRLASAVKAVHHRLGRRSQAVVEGWQTNPVPWLSQAMEITR